MSIVNLSAHQFFSIRKKLIYFLRQHGDRRITTQAIRWLKQATRKEFEKEGFLALCSLKQNRLIGVLIVADYGIKESFIAVHKHYRNQHVAKNMLQHALRHLGKMYGRVAIDNIPSLKVCLDNGMVAFHLFTGVTNKPTLWLGGGNWKKEDILDKLLI